MGDSTAYFILSLGAKIAIRIGDSEATLYQRLWLAITILIENCSCVVETSSQSGLIFNNV